MIKTLKAEDGTVVYEPVMRELTHEEEPRKPILDGREERLLKLQINDGLFIYGNAESIAEMEIKLGERMRFKQLAEAANNFINKSPGDPDVTAEQLKAYQRYIDLLYSRTVESLSTLY